MWALVESGSVTTIYTRPKAITLNGIQHPRLVNSSGNSSIRGIENDTDC